MKLHINKIHDTHSVRSQLLRIFLLAGIHDRLHAVIVADVARVDADLIHTHICTSQCSLVVKVDIRHDGDVHCVLTASMHFASAGLGQVTRKI